MDQYGADQDGCRASLGLNDDPPSVTAEEASDLYDLFLETADCVRRLGYTVPDPPSRQAFVDELVRNPIPQWHPYDAVEASQNASDIERVRAECRSSDRPPGQLL